MNFDETVKWLGENWKLIKRTASEWAVKTNFYPQYEEIRIWEVEKDIKAVLTELGRTDIVKQLIVFEQQEPKLYKKLLLLPVFSALEENY